VVETLAKLDRASDELRYDEMADAIYHFVWGIFCDWYVELIKGAFDEETKAVAAWAFDQILVMLHPLMPFITEELWSAMGERPYELIVAKWPEPQAQVDRSAKAELDFIISMIAEIRSIRAEYNIPWSERLTMHIAEPTEQTEAWLFNNGLAFVRMTKTYVARFGSIVEELDGHAIYVSVGDNTRIMAQEGSGIQFVVGGRSYLLLVSEAIDLDAEKARLDKAAATAEKERDSLAARLANPNFTERAKPEAVEKARADHDAKAAEAERLRAALERLG